MGMDNQAEKLEKMIRAFLPGDKVSYEKREKSSKTSNKSDSDIGIDKLPEIDGIEWKHALEEMEVDLADECMTFLNQFEYTDEIAEKIKDLGNKVLNLETEEGERFIEEIKEMLSL